METCIHYPAVDGIQNKQLVLISEIFATWSSVFVLACIGRCLLLHINSGQEGTAWQAMCNCQLQQGCYGALTSRAKDSVLLQLLDSKRKVHPRTQIKLWFETW